MVVEIGDPGAIQFRFSWPNTDVGDNPSSTRTRGGLSIIVADERVWPPDPGEEFFDWTWIELAEFLNEAWPWIRWELDFPLGTRPGTVSDVEGELSRRWDSMSEPARDDEQGRLYEYKEVHDLAHSLQGAILPSIWIVRQGNDAWISTRNSAVQVDYLWLAEMLESVAQQVFSRLQSDPDDRGAEALALWFDRNNVPIDLALSIVTDLDESTLATVQSGANSAASFWSVHSNDDVLNELTAAARLASALPAEEIRKVVTAAKQSDKSNSQEVDSLASKIDITSGRPFDEGYNAAIWLRSELGISDDVSIDPDELLRIWGVEVREIELDSELIDAIAVWGPLHGPAIIINTQGKYSKTVEGRRATLAHEIAHLLLDRRGALPLSDVLWGRAPGRPEVRARAFAAELLLPREVAGHAFAETESPSATLHELQEAYGVGGELIAWQARNSSTLLSKEVRSYLRTRVSHPQNF